MAISFRRVLGLTRHDMKNKKTPPSVPHSLPRPVPGTGTLEDAVGYGQQRHLPISSLHDACRYLFNAFNI